MRENNIKESENVKKVLNFGSISNKKNDKIKIEKSKKMKNIDLSTLSKLSILNKCSNLASKTLNIKDGIGFPIILTNQQKNKNIMLGGLIKENLLIEEKDTLETKFITKLMRKGKKEKAEIILIKALKKLEQELTKKDTKGNIIKNSVEDNLVLNKSDLKINLEQKNIKSKNNKLKEDLKETKGKLNIKGNNQLKIDTSSQTELHKENIKNFNLNLVKLLNQIIENAKPLIRLKKIRIAGATHQKPIALTKKQSETDAIKRIIFNSKLRSEKSAILRLAKEFEEIYLNIMSNKTLTEVRDLHKLAEINKANLTLK